MFRAGSADMYYMKQAIQDLLTSPAARLLIVTASVAAPLVWGFMRLHVFLQSLQG